MRKQVLVWIFGVVAVTQKEFEEMEEPQEVQFTDRTLWQES